MPAPAVRAVCGILVPDVAGARRCGALAVLCDGPIALRPLAQALGCPSGRLEPDLEALIAAGLVVRVSWTVKPLKWIYTLSPLGEVWRPEWRAGPR